MSARFPKRVWLLRHEVRSERESAEVLRTERRADDYRDMPGWQIVAYVRVEGQQLPKRKRRSR